MSLDRVVLVSMVVVGCGKHAQPPPAVQDDKLPDVTVAVDPPPKGDKIVIDGVHDAVAPGPETTPAPTLLAVSPDMTYAALIDTTLKLQRTNYMLLVRTPNGVGALPLLRPKAIAGSIDEDPILAITLARASNGTSQLYVGGTSVAAPDLEKTLRDHKSKRLALTMDATTTVGEVAEVLAVAHAVNPDVMLVPPPEPPRPAAPPR